MRKNCEGIAAVEFTIMLPVMLIMILATAEFGRVFYQYSNLTRLTRDAGRYLSATAIPRTTSDLVNPLTDADCNNCITRTKRLLVYGQLIGGTPQLNGLTVADINIQNLPGSDRELVITVSYDWQPLLGDTFNTLGLGKNIDLSFNLDTSYTIGAL